MNIFFKRRKYAKVEAATCSVRWNGTMLPITYFNIFCTTLLMQCTHYTSVLRSETMCCTCIVIYEYIILLIFSFMFFFFTQKIMLHWPILNIAERLTANDKRQTANPLASWCSLGRRSRYSREQRLGSVQSINHSMLQ